MRFYQIQRGFCQNRRVASVDSGLGWFDVARVVHLSARVGGTPGTPGDTQHVF